MVTATIVVLVVAAGLIGLGALYWLTQVVLRSLRGTSSQGRDPSQADFD